MTNIIKKILGIFPSDLPNKIYNLLIIFPPFAWLANLLVKSIIPTSIKIEEGTVFLNKSDIGVSGALALGSFERVELDIFRKTIEEGMNIVDIGANIGLYSIISAKRVGINGKVFVYEPEPTNINFLKKNIDSNNLKNVFIETKAMSNSAGNTKLFITKDNKGTHSLANNRSVKDYINIETDTLDNSLKKYGSPKIDIIKMDIEGAEILAIDGMRETIKNSPNLIIFSEFYPKAIIRLGGSPIGYLEKLRDLGFSIFLINEKTKKLEPLDDLDSFRIRPDFRKTLSFLYLR